VCKSESIAKFSRVQVVAQAAACVQHTTSVLLPWWNTSRGTPLAPSWAMRIDRKCPECLVGKGLARRATISPPTNKVRVWLACQSCLHEWEVEEDQPIRSSPDRTLGEC
jgi:hypothetical protein